MSTNFEDEIEQLLEESSSLAHGPEEVEILDRAIRLADSHQHLQYGFEVRKRMMSAATFGGAPEKALVAFTWCVGQCDRNPEEFDVSELLWEYKWVVSGLKQFPQIPREQIESSFEDMTKRYQECGLSLRPIHKLRSMFGIHRGDLEEARRWQRLWRNTDTGYGNDCAACELHDQVEFLLFVGKDERAVEMAQPILNNRMRCAEIPHLTYAHLLVPFMKLGQVEEAYSAHRRGYRMIADNPEFLSVISDHLIFLTLTGNHPQAMSMLAEHLQWALETSSPLRRYCFDKGALFTMQQVAAKGDEAVALDLPRSFPLYCAEGTYTPSELRDWFDQDVRGLAARFDRRNETPHLQETVDKLPDLMQWAKPYKVD